MLKLLSIKRTPGGTKEFKAIFRVGERDKIVRFGTSSNYVLNPKRTDDDRLNYLKRHRKNEKWGEPLTAGSLSRWILWESRSLDENIKNFKRRFKL